MSQRIWVSKRRRVYPFISTGLCPFLPSSLVRVRRLVQMLPVTAEDHVVASTVYTASSVVTTGFTFIYMQLQQNHIIFRFNNNNVWTRILGREVSVV